MGVGAIMAEISNEDVMRETRQALASLAASFDPQIHAFLPTTRGLEALVDRRFLAEMGKYRWYALISTGHIYAVADIRGDRVSLQRLAYQLAHPTLALSEVKQVSFLNKISFDCRVANLAEQIGRQVVMRNRRPKRGTSSTYKGVMARPNVDGSIAWRTQIKADFGSMSIGSYPDELQAAKVYDAAAFLLFGGSALYNFPGTIPDADTLAHVTRHIARRKRWLESRGSKEI